jgi:hypothetical protein
MDWLLGGVIVSAVNIDGQASDDRAVVAALADQQQAQSEDL